MSIDSNGLDCYLVPIGTKLETKADCASAISSGKRIGKIKDMGEIGGTRNIIQHEYLSKDDSEKNYGSVTYSNVNINCPFSPTDTEGQGELKAMFNNKEHRMMVIENSDGNYTVLPVMCAKAAKTYANNDIVMFNSIVEQNGKEEEITE